MNDVVISVESVSKKFCLDFKKSIFYGLMDLAHEIRGQSKENEPLRMQEFWAVNAASFTLHRGESLGLIGENGAGKTTILKMINGLMKPDRGRISITGRVGALIALGAGFNQVLSGRENIYINAAVLGLSAKETKAKFDEIVDFSELGNFIDSPVQSYSAGMQIRLGFSIASAIKPDILLLDEILAVGDVRFQAKCLGRLKEMKENGCAILFVSHALEHIAHFCDRVIWLDQGKILADSDTPTVLSQYTSHYLSDFHSDSRREQLSRYIDEFGQNIQYNKDETRWGDRAVIIDDFRLYQNGVACKASVVPSVEIELHLKITFLCDIKHPIYGIWIKSSDGGIVLNTNSIKLLGALGTPSQKEGDTIQACFKFTPYLNTGEYLVSVGVASETSKGLCGHDRRYDSIRINVAFPLVLSGEIAMNPSLRILK